jgi:S-formylglutathione hydrolase FrmB
MKKPILTVTLILITGIIFGQAKSHVDSLFSQSLGRKMPISIIVPSAYNEQQSIPILYLLHGHSINHEYFLKHTDIEQYVEEASMLCVMPQADNSWWINAYSAPEDRYEDYFMKDLVEYIEGKYNVDTESQFIAGYSMGGYGALVLALRYPDRFDFAASIAGAIMYPRDKEIQDTIPNNKFAVPSTDRAFGELPNAHRDEHDPFLIYKNTPSGDLPYIFFFTGLQDYFPEIPAAQRDLADSLNAYGALYEYHELQGGHSSRTVNPSLHILLNRIQYLKDNGYRFLSTVLFKTILESSIESTIKQYFDLKDNYKDEYIINEQSLNYLGYQLLGKNMVKEAIEIFKLNVKEYPEASNPYDSLGEAYMIDGQIELAIKNYQKSLEVNPDNTNAVKMIKKLK